jgi:pimeloyl-ACP methyl ester carboxylesterase
VSKNIKNNRRRFLGIATMTIAALLLGMSGSANAQSGHINSARATPVPGKLSAVAEDKSIRPFHINVPEEQLVDLRKRIAATRWPDKETINDESQGIRLAEMQALVRYWGTDYDWRKGEAKLNALPEFVTTIDGVDIQFIHVRSRESNALPLILTHGWPGSPLEFLKVIGPLTDPVAYGGRAEDAFDVVIPAIPGYGFSGKPTDLGWNPDRVARAWDVLMKRLGYTRYVSQGGDHGSVISGAPGAAWTARHPSHDAGHDSREPREGHQQRWPGARWADRRGTAGVQRPQHILRKKRGLWRDDGDPSANHRLRPR